MTATKATNGKAPDTTAPPDTAATSVEAEIAVKVVRVLVTDHKFIAKIGNAIAERCRSIIQAEIEAATGRSLEGGAEYLQTKGWVCRGDTALSPAARWIDPTRPTVGTTEKIEVGRQKLKGPGGEDQVRVLHQALVRDAAIPVSMGEAINIQRSRDARKNQADAAHSVGLKSAARDPA